MKHEGIQDVIASFSCATNDLLRSSVRSDVRLGKELQKWLHRFENADWFECLGVENFRYKETYPKDTGDFDYWKYRGDREARERVFEDLLHEIGRVQRTNAPMTKADLEKMLIDYRGRYAAALETVPRVPKQVAEAVEWFQQNDEDLGTIFRNAYEDMDDDWDEVPQLCLAETWIIENPNEFSKAWLNWPSVEVIERDPERGN